VIARLRLPKENRRPLALALLAWLTVQAAIAIGIRAPPSAPANVDWWLALSSFQSERGIVHVWTPYPPLFPLLHEPVVAALSGDEAPLVRRWYFESDRSPEAAAGHALVLARLVWAWRIANAILLAGIAVAVFALAREARGVDGASFAAAGFLLSQIAPWSRVRIGIGNDQFDYLAVLFLVLAVLLLSRRKPASAGAAAGLGILAKLFPVVTLGPALARAKRLREAVIPCAVAMAVSAAGLAPFAIADRQSFLSTWRYSSAREGWESVWIWPQRRYPPMPSPKAMPALYGEPLPTTLLILADQRLVSGIVVREDAEAVVMRSNGTEETFARTGIAGFGEPKRPPLRVRLLSLFAFAIALASPLALRRTIDRPGGIASASLLAVTALLFFSPGVSSYYFLWLVPLLFVVFPLEWAMACSCAFLFAGNLEQHAPPAFPLYWPALAVRQLFLAGLGLAILRPVIGRRTSAPSRPSS
jgi:hypothetical protein